MMTLVELRKFENRKKSKAGHFLARRVKREDDKSFQEAPKPRLWKDAVKAPAVPKGHQNPRAPGPTSRPGMHLPGVQSSDFPQLRPPGMAGLPVVPPPPPRNNRASPQDFAGSFAMGPPGTLEPLERGFEGQRTPTSQFSGTGQFGQTPPTGPGPALPGFPSPGQRTPGGGTPTSQRTPPGGPPPVTPPGFPPSPDQTLNRSGTGGSLGALRQSQSQQLSEQVRAGTAGAKPPPPPGSGSRGGSPRSNATPPAGPPPSYSRPKSRPSSANKPPSPGQGRGMTPPGEPPRTPPGAPPAPAEP